MDGKIFSIRTELDSELVSLSWLEQLLGLSEFQSSSSPIASQERGEGLAKFKWRSMGKYEDFSEVNGFSQKQTRSREEGSSSSLESDSSREEIFSCQKGECFTKKIDVGPLSIGPEKREDYVVVALDVAQQRCSNIVVDLIGKGDGRDCWSKNPSQNHEAEKAAMKGVVTKCHKMRTRNSKDNDQVSGQEERIEVEVGGPMRWNLGEEMSKVIEKGVALGFNFKSMDVGMLEGDMDNG
ncbi:hypothetical protein Q3G72_005167 [Acer saccharum]|nr:hypothetical protein Q3G72_005167 [Acer saccharum]